MAAIASEPVMTVEETEAPRTNWVRRVGSSFLLRRILRAILTVFFVMTLIFFLVRLMPGDPVQVYINQQMTQYGYDYDTARNMAQSLFSIDASKPIYIQYVDYMKNLLQGNLGMSISSPGTSVSTIIASRIWWTVFSVGTALIISFTLGVLLGMFMAYKRNSWIDSTLSALASITHSVPNYLIAILIITIFGVWLEWIPFVQMRGSVSSGVKTGFTWTFISDALYHAFLPIFVYVLTTIGGWMLTMKSSTVAALEEDFVTAARARGIPEWRVALFYVGRNAILPLFTSLVIQIGFVMGGSLLMEPIFQYKGIGQQLFQAIQKRDYPVLQGIFLVITISVVLANLVADLLYSRVDPRIRAKG
ncbi:MAG: ABC transporter permease [Thermomicrobiales bacterium]